MKLEPDYHFWFRKLSNALRLKPRYEAYVYADVEHVTLGPETFPTAFLLDQAGIPHAKRYEGSSEDTGLLAVFQANYEAGDTKVASRRTLYGSVMNEDRSCFWTHAARFQLPRRMFGLFEMQQLSEPEMHRIALRMRQGLSMLGLSHEAAQHMEFLESSAHSVGASFEYSGDSLVERSAAYWAFIFICCTVGVSDGGVKQMLGGPEHLFWDPRGVQIRSALEIVDIIGPHDPRLSFFYRAMTVFTPSEWDQLLNMRQGWTWEGLQVLVDAKARFSDRTLEELVGFAAMPKHVYHTLFG